MSDIVSEIDECLDVLSASPSEKTVKTANRLRELIVKYRDDGATALMQNVVNVSNSIIKGLSQLGIYVSTTTKEKEHEQE